jgi:hypothetical protein
LQIPVEPEFANAQPDFTGSFFFTRHSFYLSKSGSAIRFFSHIAIVGKKKSYVYSLPVGWKRLKESGVVEQSVIRALLFPHQWRDGLPLVGEYEDFR